MYAIIRTGGKQYRVEPGDVVRFEHLDAEVGSSVTLDDVLLVGEGDGNLRIIKVATFSEEKRPVVNRLPSGGSYNSNRLG